MFKERILVFSLMALAIIFIVPSVGYAQDVNSKEWRKAIEDTNKQRLEWAKKHRQVKPITPNKIEKTIEKKEQICLEGGQCVNADFKWGMKAKGLKKTCEVYLKQTSKQSYEGLYCRTYLKSFSSFVFMMELIHKKQNISTGILCHNLNNTYNDVFLARNLIKFLEEHPKMEELNANYVLYQMFMSDERNLCSEYKKNHNKNK